MEKPTLSIVIPTYNERENISILLTKIDNVLKNANIEYEVIVVDDDSPDRTWEVVLDFSQKGYPTKLLRRLRKKGLGTAIIDGIKMAEGDYIVVMDADLQHPPETIPLLLKKALDSGCDLVVASRYREKGGIKGWNKLRLLISKIASFLAYLLIPSSKKTTDPMSGFFLVKRDIVDEVKLEGRSWKILLEILAKKPGLKVEEIPYVFGARHRGKSKLGYKAITSYIFDLLRLSNYRILKFASVGASGTIVNLLSLYILYNYLSLILTISYALSWEISLTWNYTLHDRITFKGERPRGLTYFLKYWVKYHSAAFTGFITYMGVSNFLSLVVGLNYMFSGFIGIVLGFLANFLISQHHVWAPRS